MNTLEQFTAKTGAGVTLTAEDAARCEIITNRIGGWSDGRQYAFFRALLELPIKSLLVLGVYHGRDIAFILDILGQYHPSREIRIVGVDRFSPDPCADWPQVKEVRTWEKEIGVPPPNLEIATKNTSDPRVRLVQTDDFAFLESTEKKFDAVYLDTAHDFNTVVRQLRQVPRVCEGDAIICGDDFADHYTWGVKSAVGQKFTTYTVFAEWIWVSSLSLLKK